MLRQLTEQELNQEFEEIVYGNTYDLEFSRLKSAQLQQLTHLLESLPSFARDTDEADWRTLTAGKDSYSETELCEMRKTARKLYYTNSGARGVIDTMVNFIIGTDASVTPEDEDKKVKLYIKEFQILNRWDLRQKELVRRTLRDGESFVRFFPGNPEVRWADDYPITNPVPYIRFINPDDVKDSSGNDSYGIKTDPEDVESPILYHKQMGYRSTQIPADQIIHTKILVDSDTKRGITFYAAIAPYLVKYQQWLDDRITLNRIRTMFNLIMKVTGNPATVSAKFNDTSIPTTVSGSDKSSDTKRMPRRGSVLVSSPGIDYEFANLNIQAQDTKDDGRAIELMIGKGAGLTEYVVRGDASNANYASSMVAESPMVRSFESWQDIFAKTTQHIHRKALRWGLENSLVPAKTERTTVTIDPITGEETIATTKEDLNFNFAVAFAALIHRDIKAESEAYAIHSLHGWDSDRGISSKLGNDYDQVQVEKRREDLTNMTHMRRQEEALKKQETSPYRNPNVDPGATPPDPKNPKSSE